MAAPKTPIAPSVGQLFNFSGRTVVVSGSGILPDGTIWVMDWSSGEALHAQVKDLTSREDRYFLTSDALTGRFARWARSGNAEAMWWLGWWYCGSNHPRSIWYYIASLRAAPRDVAMELMRIGSEAIAPFLFPGVPRPDLRFLADIPELRGAPVDSDWRSALEKAEAAEHRAAQPVQM